MTPLRAVVFDIGGVLEITPTTGWQARWESALGLAPGAIDGRLQEIYRAGTIGAVTLAEAELRIAGLLDLDTSQLASFMEDLWAEYLGEINAPLYAWFRGCRPRYRTGILSNSWVGAREREHARYGFGDACDLIVYSHEEGLTKPDAAIYQRTCERLDVAADEVVFVDDLRANVEASRALGMHGILFTGDTAATLRELRGLLGEEPVA